jgi:FkbM family methyltransferase
VSVNQITVNKNNVSFKVEDSEELHQDVGYNFWSEKYSSWEPSTFQVLDKYLSKDKDYLDIGSWVGPTAIYASFHCRQVVAVEPDPTSYQILQKNISLNSINNITSLNKAASKLKTAFLECNKFFGDSMSRVSQQVNSGVSVETIGLDELISLGDFSLIKIDIEGHEFELVKEYIDILDEHKIPLLLSTHACFFSDGEYLMKELMKSFSNVKNIFDEFDKEVDPDEVQYNLGSYLFLW